MALPDPLKSTSSAIADHQGPVVAFDFDGTLTTRDTFTDFIGWHAGPVGYARGLLGMAPDILTYGIKRDRSRVKAAAVGRFWGGMPEADLRNAAEAYAEAVSSRILRPDAVATWRKWQDAGAMTIIVTASPEVCVEPFARRLAAHLLIGTRLKLDSAGCITGALDGDNCRGVEKVTRLKLALGDKAVLTAAYGDSSGDREMLAMAQEPGYRTFTGQP